MSKDNNRTLEESNQVKDIEIPLGATREIIGRKIWILRNRCDCEQQNVSYSHVGIHFFLNTYLKTRKHSKIKNKKTLTCHISAHND